MRPGRESVRNTLLVVTRKISRPWLACFVYSQNIAPPFDYRNYCINAIITFEAWARIEPAHRGFADRCVTTSPPGPMRYYRNQAYHVLSKEACRFFVYFSLRDLRENL